MRMWIDERCRDIRLEALGIELSVGRVQDKGVVSIERFYVEPRNWTPNMVDLFADLLLTARKIALMAEKSEAWVDEVRRIIGGAYGADQTAREPPATGG